MAGEAGHGDVVHRTRKSLGERLLRKLQREVAGRVLERRDFYSLKEAQIVIEKWRVMYNTLRPHPALGYATQYKRAPLLE